jgi:hypothetical protein
LRIRSVRIEEVGRTSRKVDECYKEDRVPKLADESYESLLLINNCILLILSTKKLLVC